jgi:hypothetical protein
MVTPFVLSTITASFWSVLALLGAVVILIGSAVALMAPVDEFRNAGWTKGMERGGRIAAYLGAVFAYLGVVMELPASLKPYGDISLVLVFVALLTLLITGLRFWCRVNRKQRE